MTYKIMKKARGLLSDGTPHVVTYNSPLQLAVDGFPRDSSLYISVKGKTKEFLPTEGKIIVSFDSLYLLAADEVNVLDIKIIKNKSPYNVWRLDELYVKKLDGEGYLVYPNNNRLWDMLCAVTEQCVKLNENYNDICRRLKDCEDKFEEVFAGYVTE